MTMWHPPAHHILDFGMGHSEISYKPVYSLPTPTTAQSSIWERLLLGREISKQRIQGVGGVVQCHGAEKEEATGDGAVGKEEELAEKINSNWEIGFGFQSSVPLEIFSPPTQARVISIFWVLVLCLCNSEGNRARTYVSRPLPLSSQGDESQMSGHADETVGEQQAGRVDGSFAFHPQEHNQIFK